jgi:hypothetical protein
MNTATQPSLNRRQRQVFDYVQQYQGSHAGEMPTCTEIGEALELPRAKGPGGA